MTTALTYVLFQSITPQLLESLLGPVGALMLALLGLAAVVKFRWLVPAYVYEGAEERVKMLDSENDALTKSIETLTEQNGEMKASLARLEERAKYLTEEVTTLRREVEVLRASARGER